MIIHAESFFQRTNFYRDHGWRQKFFTGLDAEISKFIAVESVVCCGLRIFKLRSVGDATPPGVLPKNPFQRDFFPDKYRGNIRRSIGETYEEVSGKHTKKYRENLTDFCQNRPYSD